MKRTALTVVLAAFSCIVLCACDRDRPAPKPQQAAVAKAKGLDPDKSTVSDVDLSDIPVPTEEDFEEAAERDITLDNLATELNRMEKEIGE
jgi:hypothetical protein